MTRIITTREFQAEFERFQEEAKASPIAISRDGRTESVLVSVDMYDLIVKGRVARSVADIDEATLDAIRSSEVPSGFDHLETLLGDWTP